MSQVFGDFEGLAGAAEGLRVFAHGTKDEAELPEGIAFVLPGPGATGDLERTLERFSYELAAERDR